MMTVQGRCVRWGEGKGERFRRVWGESEVKLRLAAMRDAGRGLGNTCTHTHTHARADTRTRTHAHINT